MQGIELAGRFSLRTPGLDEAALFIELRDPRIAITVGDENISRCVPSHIGRPVENVSGRAHSHRRRRRSINIGAAPRSAVRTSGHQRPYPHCPSPAMFIAGAECAALKDANILRLPAHRHHDSSLRVELDDHVRAFIHHPDVVFRIDSHGVRKREPVRRYGQSRGRSFRSGRIQTAASRRSRTPASRPRTRTSCRCACRRKRCSWSQSPRRLAQRRFIGELQEVRNGIEWGFREPPIGHSAARKVIARWSPPQRAAPSGCEWENASWHFSKRRIPLYAFLGASTGKRLAPSGTA